MSVIFHVGTHKTATTSFQRYLASNRRQLEQANYCYPQYAQLIDTNISHYSHIDLARSIDPGISSRFSSEQVHRMFARMEALSQQGKTILASGEPLWRVGFSGSEKHSIYASKNKLIKPFWDYLGDPYIFITLRLLPDFILSMYSEHVLQTGYSEDVDTFASRYYFLFDYSQAIKYWSELGTVRLCCYEESLLSGHLGNYMLSCMIAASKIPLRKYKRMPMANQSLPFPLLAYKRYLNSQSLAPASAKAIVKALWECPLVRNDSIVGEYLRYSWFDADQWLSLLKLSDHDWLFRHYASHRFSTQSIRNMGYIKAIAKARSLRSAKKQDLARILSVLDDHRRRLNFEL